MDMEEKEREFDSFKQLAASFPSLVEQAKIETKAEIKALDDLTSAHYGERVVYYTGDLSQDRRIWDNFTLWIDRQPSKKKKRKMAVRWHQAAKTNKVANHAMALQEEGLITLTRRLKERTRTKIVFEYVACNTNGACARQTTPTASGGYISRNKEAVLALKRKHYDVENMPEPELVKLVNVENLKASKLKERQERSKRRA